MASTKIGHDTYGLPLGTIKPCVVFDVICRPEWTVAVCVMDDRPQTGISCAFRREQISPNRGDRGFLIVTASPRGNFWAYREEAAN